METKNLQYPRINSIYSNAYAAHHQASQGYQHNNDMGSLIQGFHGLSMAAPYGSPRKSSYMASGPGSYYNPLVNGNGSAMYGPAGHYGYPALLNGVAQSGNIYAQHSVNGSPSGSYHPYAGQDHSPLSQTWTSAMTEVPTLITPRRDSASSAENDQPSTPSYGGLVGLGIGGLALDRSPSGIYGQNTPSPGSILGPYGNHGPKRVDHADVSPRIKLLVSKEPSIPHAIPAPSSPLKPLDRALENQRGETNVYIRGLLPETTDEQLEIWGGRFGDVKSSKSIIDFNTGLCKGFGFVKYHNYEDAENCIRGFHYLGYEVSFARESFYSKLKTFADEKNTNLYVSNLPKTMNEHELANLFAPHKVYSTRILRDHKSGHGRGVGFARFDSRDTCEEIIKIFNSHTIQSGEEEMQIQIRYADTGEQKTLKQQTQAARQFRSAEYEFATQAWRQTSVPPSDATSQNNGAPKPYNEFEHYLGTQGEASRARHRSTGPQGSSDGHADAVAQDSSSAHASSSTTVEQNQTYHPETPEKTT